MKKEQTFSRDKMAICEGRGSLIEGYGRKKMALIVRIFPLRSSRCIFRDLNDFFVKCRNKSFCTRLCYKVFLVHFNVSLQTFLTIVQSGIFVQEDSQRDDKCSNAFVVKYDSFV